MPDSATPNARCRPFWPPGVPDAIVAPERHLFDNVRLHAQASPDKAALFYYGRAVSYAELHDLIERLAAFLAGACGLRRGERVLVDLQNCPQGVASFFGAQRANGVPVLVNPMNLTDELDYLLQDSGARVAVVGQELFERIEPLIGSRVDHVILVAYGEYAARPSPFELPDAVQAPVRRIERAGVHHWEQVRAHAGAPPPLEATIDDLAVLMYTSGTTGNPKGCMHTHRTIMSAVAVTTLWNGVAQDAIVLTAMPQFHITGLVSNLNSYLYAGATLVQMSRWNARTAARMIERHRPTRWAAISTMVIDLLALPDAEQCDLSSLQRIHGGGAAMPAGVYERLHRSLGIDYVEGYGLTETAALTLGNPWQRPKKACLGIPVATVDAIVIDPETHAVLGPETAGEILLAGPQVFVGYWNRPEASELAFVTVEGRRWFRTGDLGRYDDEGYFFITDRLKRMINASGFKVWPAEIEASLFRHPAIQEACVIGTRDVHRGETVKALVVLRPESRGVTRAEDIIAWSREHMAAYKVPRVIEFVDSLPRTGGGKVLWRELQRLEDERLAGEV